MGSRYWDTGQAPVSHSAYPASQTGLGSHNASVPPGAPPTASGYNYAGATMIQGTSDVRMGSQSFPSGAPVAPNPSMPQVPATAAAQSHHPAGPPIVPVLSDPKALASCVGHHIAADVRSIGSHIHMPHHKDPNDSMRDPSTSHHQRSLPAHPSHPHWPGPHAAQMTSVRDINQVALSRLQQEGVIPKGATQVEHLPDAYQMYNFGNRQVYYNTRVPVDEPNHGVMINAEFPTEQRHLDGSICGTEDEAIRNRNWKHIGKMLNSAETFETKEPLPKWLAEHADYSHCYDLKGEHRLEFQGHQNRFRPDYDTMAQQRADDNLWKMAMKVKEQMRREVIAKESKMQEFWQDRAAVAFH